jgi:hypothetical protein
MSVDDDRVQQLQAEVLKQNAELRVAYTELRERERRAEAVEARKTLVERDGGGGDARVLEAQLQAKEAELTAIKRVQEAEVSKERAEKESAVLKERVEKESALKEVQSVREAAAKDIQIARLEMQLELAQERARLEMRLGTRLRAAEDSEDCSPRAKVRRLGQRKMDDIHSFFTRLVASKWANEVVGVNTFTRLTVPEGADPPPSSTRVRPPSLRAGVAHEVGADEEDTDDDDDVRYRAFGFCYKGPALPPAAFARAPQLKEAYGVKVDDLHYVCVVCFNKHSRKLSLAPTLPYAGGPLPYDITPELVPGRQHHISAYKPFVSTDDPILEMLKRPSTEKWFWHSAGVE